MQPETIQIIKNEVRTITFNIAKKKEIQDLQEKELFEIKEEIRKLYAKRYALLEDLQKFIPRGSSLWNDADIIEAMNEGVDAKKGIASSENQMKTCSMSPLDSALRHADSLRIRIGVYRHEMEECEKKIDEINNQINEKSKLMAEVETNRLDLRQIIIKAQKELSNMEEQNGQ